MTVKRTSAAVGSASPRSGAAAGAPPTSLDRLPLGSRGVVRSVGTDHEATLAREGIEPGSDVVVEASAPFGGPIVVRVGRARLALARSVARTVAVEAATR